MTDSYFLWVNLCRGHVNPKPMHQLDAGQGTPQGIMGSFSLIMIAFLGCISLT
jgi:hypothetical protein